MFTMNKLDYFVQRGKYWYRINDPGHAYAPDECSGCGEVGMMRRSKPGKYCSHSCANRVRMIKRWEQSKTLLAGQNNGMWKGDDASWSAIHKRIYAERGKASTHPCAFCDDSATDWAWNNAGDPTDTYSFFPACRTHHRRYDVATRMMSQDPASDSRIGWKPSVWLVS